MNTTDERMIVRPNRQQTDISGSHYQYPTLIEPIHDGNVGTAVKDYRVVGQDSSFPHPLFYGTYDECVKWRSENCR